MTTPAKTTTAKKKTAPAAKKTASVKTDEVKPVAKAEAPKAEAKPAAAPKPVAKKVAPAAAPKAEAEKASAPAVEANIDLLTKQIQEGYDEMMDFGKEQMEKFFKFEGSADMTKSYEEAMAFNKENVDAVVKSSSIAAKGVQDVASLFVEITKSAIEGNVEASKKLFECKNPQEALEMQTEMMKSGYDKMIADATRISEASTKIAEEAAKPLQERLEASAEKFNVKAA